MCRYNRVLSPGLNFTVPLVEWISYTHTLKELALNVTTQQAITRDNVTIQISGVLYIRIIDPFRASYGVDQPLFAVMQLAQTSMRSELGKMTLDNTFEERDSLNEKIVRVRTPLQVCWVIQRCHVSRKPTSVYLICTVGFGRVSSSFVRARVFWVQKDNFVVAVDIKSTFEPSHNQIGPGLKCAMVTRAISVECVAFSLMPRRSVVRSIDGI